MRPLLMLASLGILAAATAAAANPVTLEFSDLPPFTYVTDGHPAGQALELAKEITADLDIPLRPQMVPLRRVNIEAATNPLVVAAIVRTTARDDLYQWIGKICSDPFVMATRAPHPAINSLDEARDLNLIAVAAGATNEAILLSQGFTNLDVAASIGLEVRRLAEGHDDAWFIPRSAALFAWKAAGYDPAQLRFGTPLASMEIWMAASTSVPEPLVETLRARFAQKAKAGAVGCPE